MLTIDGARAAGRAAFEAGAPRIPALVPGLTEAVCNGAGTVCELLDAWLRGWDLANLAAPIEG